MPDTDPTWPIVSWSPVDPPAPETTRYRARLIRDGQVIDEIPDAPNPLVLTGLRRDSSYTVELVAEPRPETNRRRPRLWHRLLGRG